MSSASPFRRPLPDSLLGLQRFETLVSESVRFAGFWSAVTLPFVLLGLMVAGLAAQYAGLFAALLASNLLALRLGHFYKRE